VRTPVIVGIGATRFARRSAASEHTLAVHAIAAALTDAGLGPRDVDGVVRFDREAVWEHDLSAGLGIPRLDFYNAVPFGPGSAPALVRMAAMAIAQDLASVVLGYHARNRPVAADPVVVGGAQYQVPFGVTSVAHEVAMLTRRHMGQHRMPEQALAAVTLGLRRHAARNPRALARAPLTLAAYRRSPFVAEPLRRVDCAGEAAGAGAFVMASLEHASRRRHRPIRVLSSMQLALPSSSQHLTDWYRPGRARALERQARALFRAARVRPADVDVAFFYDAVSPLVLFGLEDFGFCAHGRSGAHVLGRGLGGRRARPVVNPNGGQLGEAHLDGVNNLLAAVRELRGGARIALVAGSPLEPTSAVLLGA
jgi:acetyl-CoA acetyltransferase